MKIRHFILSLASALILSTPLFSADAFIIRNGLEASTPPFTYPLKITVYPAQNSDANVTVCMHGYGGNYTTGEVIRQSIDEHVVSFNFPDANIRDKPNTVMNTSYGTIQELLPAIYVVKQCLACGNLDAINLYGFSAGGGAVVNMLAVLNRHDYDAELRSIGIGEQDKKKILNAVQKGYVILDCPLKSMEEILDFRNYNPNLAAVSNAYSANNLRPIDCLNDLEGLSLTILLNFQNPDEALSNRDDGLYIARLQNANRNGKTVVVISHNKGHVSYHPDLWKAYQERLGRN